MTALITGASSGIGAEYARQLAARGRDLVLVARRGDRLRSIADELQAAHGVAVETLPADLEDDAGVAAVAERIVGGPLISMLVNNAGYAVRGGVATLDPAALARMLQLNVAALAALSHAAMARMTAAGEGAIINIASGTAFMQMPGNAGYGASKSFVVAFTRHMQAEAAGTGVAVQLLVPGIVATDFHAVAGNDLARIPAERVMTAPDLVTASLVALDRGEPACMPSVPDPTLWDGYVAAERAIAATVSRDTVAERYRA